MSKLEELKELIWLWRRVSFREWLKQLENLVDDPFDWCKEWLYNEGEGRVIWKWRIIFDCIMMNRPGGCRIERIK
jgi:hypothetical protein